jgi:hypothetical protein
MHDVLSPEVQDREEAEHGPVSQPKQKIEKQRPLMAYHRVSSDLSSLRIAFTDA